MIIKVAGFNCDIESIQRGNIQDATCETIAAGYAKISRDPRPISEIRKDARENVKNSRDLNRRVVFDMGHSSIAEHAVFNLDIIGISRLAAEYVEHFRLASYTEKSQRYIKLGEDFVIPSELKGDLLDEYISFIKDSFSLYEEIYQKILPFITERKSYPNEELKRRDIEGLAMEDARYVLPLAITTQLGLTANARNIEYIIKILASSNLKELQDISKGILAETIKYAPSLIRYTEPGKYFNKYWYSEPQEERKIEENYHPENDGVNLISINQDINHLIGAFTFFKSNKSLNECIKESSSLNETERQKFIYDIFKLLDKHDQLPRFYESIILEYELIMSASCYAQFKRHRMMTQIPQPYSPSLGIEIPPLVSECGFTEKVLKHFRRGISLYHQIYKINKYAAEYVILNGNRRRVYSILNARELYHMSRLRMDHHAQWEIRRLTRAMVTASSSKIPFVFDLCCGKDVFEEYKGRIFR